MANNYLLGRGSFSIIFNYDLFIFECFFWTLAFGGFWLFNLLAAFFLVYWYDSILAFFLTLVIIFRSVGFDDILRSCIDWSSWIWFFTIWESHIIITYMVIVNRFRFGLFIAQFSGVLFVVIDWGGLEIVKIEILLCQLPLNSPWIGASTLIIQTSQTTLQTQTTTFASTSTSTSSFHTSSVTSYRIIWTFVFRIILLWEMVHDIILECWIYFAVHFTSLGNWLFKHFFGLWNKSELEESIFELANITLSQMAASRISDKKYYIFNFCMFWTSKNISQIGGPPSVTPDFCPYDISHLEVVLNIKLLIEFTYPSICICAD